MSIPYRRQTGDRVSYSRTQTARYRSDYLRWLRAFSLSPTSVYRTGGLTCFDFARSRGRYTVIYDPSQDARGQTGAGRDYLDCVPNLDRCVEVRATNTYRRVRWEFRRVNGVITIDEELPPFTETLQSAWRTICPGEDIYYESFENPPSFPLSSPISLLTIPIDITTVYGAYYWVRRSFGPWDSLAGWGGFSWDSGDGPNVWRGEDRVYLDAIEYEFRDLATLESLPAYCPPMPVGDTGTGDALRDGYSCDCPDYAKLERPDLRSPYPSRSRLRDWRRSRAGAPDPPRRCKHIYAAMRARGENPQPYTETRIVFGWPDLPSVPPDADPLALIRQMRDRRRRRRQDERARRAARREELRAFVRDQGFYEEYGFAFYQPHLNAPEAIRQLRLDYVAGVFDQITQAQSVLADPTRGFGPYPYSRAITGDEVYQYLYQSFAAAQRRGDAAARRAIQGNLEGD